jgi:hypothetical protein
MLDLIFAISVFIAVIFFGALLSVGYERQRIAIDDLREQAARWAEYDLRLKRARAAREVQVDDPRAWLNRVANHILDAPLDVVSVSAWRQEETRAIVAQCGDGRRLVVTPLQPDRFWQAIRPKGGSRLQRAEVGLLGTHPMRTSVYELSIITAGTFFDLEAAQDWQAVLGEPLESDRWYLIEVPAVRQR